MSANEVPEMSPVDEQLQLLATTVATIMALSQDSAVAPMDGCSHVLKVRHSKSLYVCAVCRKMLKEQNRAAIILNNLAEDMPEGGGS